MKFSIFNAQRRMKLKIITSATAVILVSFFASICTAQVVINGAQEFQFGNSLALPPGSQLYIYGMKGGGCCSTSPFLDGQSVSVTNGAGVTAAQLGVTTVNSNSFSTGDAYYVIGGFGASDYKYVQAFYGANPGPAIGTPTSFSMTGQVSFVLSAPATVVVIAMGDVAQTVSGLPGMVTDAPSPNSQGYVAFEIDHANLGPGAYTAQVVTVPDGASQILNEQVALIAVLIFSDQPDAATSSNPEIPLPGSTDTVFQFPACVNGLQVDINGGASPGASVASIEWSWGDGQQTTGFFPQSHTYSSAGQYAVQVAANYGDGSSASASQTVTVAPGILSGCVSLTIAAGQGGSVSYQASVGLGTVAAGTSTNLQLDYADDLSLTADPCPINSFSDWSASSGISGLPNGTPVGTNSASIAIVVNTNSQIVANFSAPCAASLFPNTSQSWCGYALGMWVPTTTEFQVGAVSDIKGTWTVPTILDCSFPDRDRSSTWIGIGGVADKYLVQVGTAQNCNLGRPENYAWFEAYPKKQKQIHRFPVNPGDIVSAEISFLGDGQYRLTIENVTQGVSTNISVSQPSNQNDTAEWIVEAPQGILRKTWPLADFGKESFSNCSVTLNSKEVPANSCTVSGYVITMEDGNDTIKAQPSSLSCDGTSFSVMWQHK
jgi:hypothetical protein